MRGGKLEIVSLLKLGNVLLMQGRTVTSCEVIKTNICEAANIIVKQEPSTRLEVNG